MLIKKRKTQKTAKGYRLKKSTHKLIDRIQVILKADQDTVITRACKLLYKELANKKAIINDNSKHFILKNNSKSKGG